MKKVFMLALALLLAFPLAACGNSIVTQGGNSGGGTTTAAPDVTKQPDAVSSQAPASEPASDLSLTTYFPSGQITLPPGSEIVKIFNDFADKADDNSCWETTVLRLSMNKSEAIAYFTPMLKTADADRFEESGASELIPLEIMGAYPEVKTLTELYASYASGDIRIIKVVLFTKEDNETVVLAYINVNYGVKPANGQNLPE